MKNKVRVLSMGKLLGVNGSIDLIALNNDQVSNKRFGLVSKIFFVAIMGVLMSLFILWQIYYTDIV